MKKLSFILLSLFLFSCSDFKDLHVPESVSVKSSTKLELPAGEACVSLHDKLSITKLQKILDDNIPNSSEIKPVIYDYNPGKKSDSEAVLQYIIDYPIKEFSLSLGDTDSDIADISFDSEIDLNLQDKVDDIYGNNQPNGSFVLADTGNNASFSVPPVNISLNTELDFSQVKMSQGTIDISVAPVALSPDGLSFSAKLSLYSGSTLIASETKECTSGGIISFDLAGKTLSSTGTKLVISGTFSDTDGNPESCEYAYLVTSSNMKVEKITGLNMSADKIGAVTISETRSITGLNSILESAVIKSGNLSFNCKLPDNWTGVIYDEDNSTLNFNQVTSGGLNISDSDLENVGRRGYVIDKKVSLENQSVNSSDIELNGSASFSLNNATLVFSDSGNKLKISGTCRIDKLSELTIKLSELTKNFSDSIDTGINFSTILSSLVKNDENLVKNIKFKGLEGYIFIQQPSENETLKSFSATIGLSATSSSGSTTLISSGSSFSMKSSNKTLASFADSKNLITENWTDSNLSDDEKIYSAKVTSGSLDSLINSHPDNLKFSYSVKLGGTSASTVTLTESELDSLTNNSVIRISIAIVMPFVMVFDDVSDGTNDGTIVINDMLSLFDNEFDEDLLHRDDDFDSEDFTKYTDIIESMSFIYTLKNTTPFNGEIPESGTAGTVKLTFYDENAIIDAKEFETDNGKNSISFSTAEIKKIMETKPFIPKLRLEISGADGSTERVFYRNSAFSISAGLSVKTNGTIELWNKDKEEDD